MTDISSVINADYESRSAKIKAITTELEKGVKELFQSDKYTDYLKMMAKLHNYSANNCLLIMLQKPDANIVAGMSTWNRDFQRFVSKGEHGIMILAPSPYKKQIDVPDYDSEGKQITREDGSCATHRETVQVEAYKPVYVYDVSQTHGKPVPKLGVDELKGEIQDYNTLFAAIATAAPCEVVFEDISSGAKGYYDTCGKRIVVKSGMGQVQAVKTLAHEVFHSILHDKDIMKTTGEVKDRQTKEVEAESCAYTLCSYFGIDTSDYSLGYIAGWSQGKDVSVLKESMETIRKASADLIDKVEQKLGLCLSDTLAETPVLTRSPVKAL